MRIQFNLISTVLCSLLWGCTSGSVDDPVTQDSDPPAGPVSLNGSVSKGPFVLGSTVNISPLSDQGVSTGQVFSTQTHNNLGEFNVVLSADGFVALEGTGFYFDERQGVLSGAPLTLRAFYGVTESSDQVARVNPFTHLSNLRVRSLALAGTPIDQAITQAEAELVTELGIGPQDFELAATGTALDLLGDDTPDNAYLMAVSVILLYTAALEGNSPDAQLQQLMNTIAADLEDDGQLAASIREQLRAGESEVDVDQVTANLAARLVETGQAPGVPELGTMIDSDHDDFMFANDCDDHNPALNSSTADEVCDGMDNDCDGLSDDADDDVVGAPLWYQDLDGDGEGDSAITLQACMPGEGWVSTGGDCAVADPDLWGSCGSCTDNDGDDAYTGCDAYTVRAGPDCDDEDPSRSPDSLEYCNDIDDDCNATTLEISIPQDYATIQEAIDASASKGAVCIAAGTYAESLDIGGRDLVLEGLNGSDVTIIDATGRGASVVHALDSHRFLVQGLTLRGGGGSEGSGLTAGCVGSGCVALQHGIVRGVVVEDGNTGSAVHASGDGVLLEIEDSVIRNNSGGSAGVSVSSNGSSVDEMVLVLRRVEIRDNVGSFGGAIDLHTATLEAYDVVADNNQAGVRGGGILSDLAELTLERVTLSRNSAPDGAGIWMQFTSGSIDGLELVGNLGDTYAAGWMSYFEASAPVRNLVVRDNQSITGPDLAIWMNDPRFLGLEVVGNRGEPAMMLEVTGREPTRLDLSNASIAGNAGDGLSIHGPVAASGSFLLRHITAAGNGGNGVTVTFAGDHALTVDHGTLAHNGAIGLSLSGGLGGTVAYTDSFDNAAGDLVGIADATGGSTNIAVDPGFMRYGPALAALDWDLHLHPSSLAIDAGDPIVLDPDGSTADVGAYGGPDAAFGYYADVDADGLYDGWETLHGLNLSADDSALDGDGDGLTTGREFDLGTWPDRADSDGDGVEDGAEVSNGTDPLDLSSL